MLYFQQYENILHDCNTIRIFVFGRINTSGDYPFSEIQVTYAGLSKNESDVFDMAILNLLFQCLW